MDLARTNRWAAAGDRESTDAQLALRDEWNAHAEQNYTTRDGTASPGELVDRHFKLLGRVGENVLSSRCTQVLRCHLAETKRVYSLLHQQFDACRRPRHWATRSSTA